MSIVSYAQNFEDVLLWRALGHVEQGRYLDIGAQDPVVDSVSFAFYQAGWRGVHVEPIPFYASRLREARPDETVIEAAVTDTPGPMTFYEISGTGLSTGDKEIAAHHRKSGIDNQRLVVPSVRLDELLDMAADDIHWMKIDVEGMEADVLRSWGDSPLRPWVLAIEATYPNSQNPMQGLWIDDVLRRGYKEVHFDGLSRFFVHDAHEELAKYFESCPNVFDEFGISPSHWAAREVDRIYQEQLTTARTAGLQLETELRQKIDAAQAQAAEAANYAATASAERDQARSDAAGAKFQLDAASRHHHESLAALTNESDRLRSEVSSGSARLLEAEREHREALVQQWREWRVVEADFRAESRDREDDLQAALRSVMTSAASAQIDLAKAHAAEIARLNETLRTARDQFFGEWQGHDRVLRQEHEQVLDNVRRRADDEKRALQNEFQSAIRAAEANAATAKAKIESRVAEIQDLLDETQEAERLAAERHRMEHDQISAEAAVLRAEIALALNERDDARAGAEQIRAVAEQIDALLRIAMISRSGLWNRIGEALGLAPQMPHKADGSFPIIPPRPASIQTPHPTRKSESTVPSITQPDGRTPYLAAHSIAELLSWHDADFVRCAYVTILGRQPDTLGEAYYTDRIRRGESKMEVLRRLRHSPEGPNHDPGIAGLDRALNKGAIFRIWGLRWLAPVEFSRARTERLLRSIGNATDLLDRNNQILVVASDKLTHYATAIGEAEQRPIEVPSAKSSSSPDGSGPITIEQLLKIARGN